jgi:cell shape-determining protein MreC
VSELQASEQQLAATNDSLRQQLAALQGSQAELQQLQDRLAQAEQLREAVTSLTAENAQVCTNYVS